MTSDESAKAFEAILTRTRPFGFYQKRLFLLTTLLQSLCWMILMYLNFLKKHSWEEQPCLKSVIKDIVSVGNFTNSTESPLVQTTAIYTRECEESFNVTSQVRWTLPKWLTWGPDAILYEYVWYGQNGGIIAGAFVGGFFGDLVGRKVISFLMFACMSMAQGMVALSEDWLNFLLFRSLVGLFAGGFAVTSMVLTVEHVGRNWRDVCVCSCLWTLGIILLSFEGWLTQNWRYLAIATSATSLPFIGTYFIFPESFRWYGCRERFAESEAGIREITSANTTSVPDVTSLCDRARLAVLNSMHKRTHTFSDLFRTRKSCRYTVAAIVCWSVSCAVYRCLLERMDSLTGNDYIDICITYTIDLPIVFSAIIINKCIGRRWCLFLYGTSSGFALMCIIVLHITNNLDKDEQMVTSISVFGKLGVTASIALTGLVTIETYPTAIRCMGTSVGIMSGVVGCAVGRQILSVASKNFHYTLPYIGYGVLMTIVGFSGLLFSETLDRPLPDLLPSRHRLIGIKEVSVSTQAWGGAR
ncbi:solute carrier family 22 member 4-like [Mizuhopecten yessoensis]|uniref:solute carrier family 22 member 4-like n=1 Tax=Mizuhopecten yessoensis TaxID=6573 RepID=UPI000B45AF63|nr:solute carrier family 22 member 4-like [Mizuhopecten yessoensis]